MARYWRWRCSDKRFPTPEERAELVRLAVDGDDDARDRLVESYLPLARRLAGKAATRRVLPPSIDSDDLNSIAAMAIMEAVRTFDPERGAEIGTWIYRVVCWRLRGAIASDGSAVYVPAYYPSDGLSPETLAKRDAAITQGACSIHDWDSAHHDQGPQRVDDLEFVASLLRHLTRQERLVVEMRFGLAGETLAGPAIGKRMGFSRQRANQLQEAAMLKLRAIAEGRIEA